MKNSISLSKSVSPTGDFARPLRPSTTYELVVRSKEKRRAALENLIYALLTMCVVASIWQFAQQSLALPTKSVACSQQSDAMADRQHHTSPISERS
jgi:hypothetical protein